MSALGGMSTIPKLSINDRLTLNQADASYILSIECQTAIGWHLVIEILILQTLALQADKI